MKSPVCCQWLTQVVACIAATLLCSAPACADYKGQMIVFPEVLLPQNSKQPPPLEQQASSVAVNFFYTAAYQQTRLLAELLANGEERDLERLAVGWVSPQGSQIWFGRLHSALDPWNRKYHHGAYLQTTIYRPGLIEFEDSGGVIPTHLTGAVIEAAYEDAAYITHYTLNVGLGPELTPGYIKALDVLHPQEGDYRLSIVSAISRRNIDAIFDDSGLYAGYVQIPSSVSGITDVAQKIFGGYINTSLRAWHLSLSATWIDLRLDLTSGDNKNEGFGYAYLQPEYWLNHDWILYGRSEGSYQGQASLFLQQLPGFVRHRNLVGARYQLSGSQALKFELASMDQFGRRFNQVALQWSAALP